MLTQRTTTIHQCWYAQEGCLVSGWCLAGCIFTLRCLVFFPWARWGLDSLELDVLNGFPPCPMRRCDMAIQRINIIFRLGSGILNFDVPNVFPPSFQIVLIVFPMFSHQVFKLFSLCSQCFPIKFSNCSHRVPNVFPSSFQIVLIVFPMFSHQVLKLFSSCSQCVLKMFPIAPLAQSWTLAIYVSGQGEVRTSIIQFWECKLLVGGVPKVSEFVLVMD
jgi:hypothetical protein